MKLFLSIVLVPILTLSCGSNETTETTAILEQEDSVVTPEQNISTESTISETYGDTIRTLVDQAKGDCNSASNGHIINEESWVYCQSEDKVECVFIEKKVDDTIYKENYILQNNNLVYAYESELLIVENDTIAWSCDYILKGQQVFSFSSNGHGETEMDEWLPESIFDQWKSHETAFFEIKNLKK